MINKILIANRGEIACRIIKTARKLGISTVAVYSTVDENSLHVKMADEAVAIGPAPSNESYLVVEKIIAAAKQTQADAIHPGYGFLSENVSLRQACDDQGLIFIGPSVNAIESMGSKSAAKEIMSNAGVPLVPGYHGDDQSPEVLKAHSDAMGYPVLLKASAGGGGKGMRQVWAAEEFDQALQAAKRESLKSFNDDKMLVEKYLTKPRHVEVQVFCDEQGNAVYLADRDCSIQRRHQKVIEEAPAPNIDEAIRQKMGEAAILAAKAIDYTGAGTVEFLLDEDNSFYFMEMNTRLQVEHPVTEKITDLDLVELQIQVANGKKLPLSQDQVRVNGHAFEARIYAEDPSNDFLPASGFIETFSMPIENQHIRIDTGVCEKDSVSIFYDPMVAKLIVWAEDRDKALKILADALAECNIQGPTTNLQFLYNLACHPALRDAELDTNFIESHEEIIFKTRNIDTIKSLIFNAIHSILNVKNKEEKQALSNQTQLAEKHVNDSLWSGTGSWRMNQVQSQLMPFFLQNDMHEVFVSQTETNGQYQISLNRSFPELTQVIEVLTAKYVENHLHIQLAQSIDNASASNVEGNKDKSKELSALVFETDHSYQFFTESGVYETQKYSVYQHDHNDDPGNVNAALHGTVVTLLVKLDQFVKKGDALLVMEAMKMEHTITAPTDGSVAEFYFKAGDMVESGIQLLDFKADTP